MNHITYREYTTPFGKHHVIAHELLTGTEARVMIDNANDVPAARSAARFALIEKIESNRQAVDNKVAASAINRRGSAWWKSRRNELKNERMKLNYEIIKVVRGL